MDMLKIGVIGIGNIGRAHLKCIYNNEVNSLKVTAICDIQEEKLAMVKENYADLETFTDYKALITSGKVEAVLIAVPHVLHGEIAIYALEHGLHVLVEKPVDVSVSVASRLNEVAAKSGKVFSIMFNQRTNSHYLRARNLIQGNQLGELKSVRWTITNWYRTQAYYNSGSWRGTWEGEGGGVLMNQAPHNMDLLQWICGMPETVTAFCYSGKHHNIDVEDDVTMFLEYANGATGVFTTSTGEYPGTNRLEINGSKGKIVIEDGIFKHWNLKEDERKVCFESDKGFHKIEYDYTELTEYTETAHKGIIQNFTNAVLFGEELIANGMDGIHQISLTNAAYLSESMGNQKITLPVDSVAYDEFLKTMKLRGKKNSAEKAENMNESYSDRWQVRW